MPPPEPFLIFTRKFNELGLRYMISGSVAAIFYGEPRMTNDIDVVVFLHAEEVEALEKAFPIEEFYCPPPDVIHMEIARSQRGHFNLIHHATGFKADIYPCSDSLHAWGLARTNVIEFEGDHIVLAPPEYVIIRKLQFFREGGSQKHLRDISRMVNASGDGWEPGVLSEMIQRFQLEAEWNQVLALKD